MMTGPNPPYDPGPPAPSSTAPQGHPATYPQAPAEYSQAPTGYAQTQSSYAPSPGPGATPTRNPVGLVAFITGMLLVLWQLVGAAIQAWIAVSAGVPALQAFAWINSGVGLLLGIVTIVAGVVALLLKGRPRVLGAIGLGIGILNLAAVLAYSVVYTLVTELA